MKKSLLAVAVLGAMSGAAFAQVAPNNITLYGIVDAGLTNDRVTTTTSTGVSTSASVSGLSSGVQSGSRWGLRGSEDLGGGLRANFNLESGFSLDTGVVGQSTAGSNPRLFGRASWVGLSGGFGEVRAGRMAIFSSAFVTGIADPFGNGFSLAGWQFSSLAAGTQRNDNTIMYLSPNMSGLQGGIYYTFGEQPSPVPASTAKANWIGAGVTYTQGPLALGLAYDTRDSSTNATNSRDDKWLNLAASYNFGVATVRFGYVDEQATGIDTDAFIIGANIPLAGGVLLASYQNGENKFVAAGVGKDKFRNFAVGYTYPLSRRTNIYTHLSQGRIKDSITPEAVKARQFSLGVRHTF